MESKFKNIGLVFLTSVFIFVVICFLASDFSCLNFDFQTIDIKSYIKSQFFPVIPKLYSSIFCTVIFILVFTIIKTTPILFALFVFLSLMVAYFALYLCMHSRQISIDFLLPELYMIISVVCCYLYKILEKSKKNKIQNAMGKYLSYDVMKKVVRNIDNIELGGKIANVSILFADIRNFTKISENMNPNLVTKILNEYFSALVPIIEEHNGILNKFVGDAVLAVFGEPKKTQNHAYDAIKCADKMLKKIKNLQEKWLNEGKPKIEIGIGVSSGDVFVGNIGSNDRLEYTVIGDTVNTASRIENYNKVYKTNFLISESTYNLVKNKVDVVTINNVSIRGKSNKINLYEVIRLVD